MASTNRGPVTVCRIIARLNVGGPAIHTILLTSRLPAERYRSILVKGTEAPAEGNMSGLAKQEGVEPIVIEELGREVRPLYDLAAFAKLTKLLWRERPAIVHTHTAKAGALGRMASLVVNFAWAARRQMGLPAPPSIRSVHTYHGNVFHGYFSPLKTRLYLAIERALARFTDVVIVISPLQRSEIVEKFKIAEPSRVRLIPLGLDLGPFRNCSNYRGKLRAELGLGETTRLIGIVGRLVPIKRHDLLLEAISLLKDSKVSGGGFCCVVVGDGELRSALERRAEEMELSEYVRFLGWRRDLETVYADLDCLVLTSDNEGTPVSVIEALSAGVPVVATAVGGVPDLLSPLEEGEVSGPVVLSNGEPLDLWRAGEDGAGDIKGPRLAASGLLTPAGDARALALALELLWSEPNLVARCALRGSSWVQEAFVIERLVSDIDSLYKELLGDRIAGVDGALGEEAA